MVYKIVSYSALFMMKNVSILPLDMEVTEMVKERLTTC